MYPDHEFDPITPEEEAQRAQEAEFARRVRREVLRIDLNDPSAPGEIIEN